MSRLNWAIFLELALWHLCRPTPRTELAAQEGVDRVRVQKTLKLSRLVPELAEDIAAGRIPVGLSFEFFIRRELPDEWVTQRQVIAALSESQFDLNG